MKRRHLVFTHMVKYVVSVCLLTGSLSVSLAQSLGSRGQERFRSGDGIRILVWQNIGIDHQSSLRDLGIANDYLIDGRGNILVPILGEVKAAGHTPISMAETIQKGLAIKTIQVVCLPLIRVAVLGAVHQPGSYLIQPTESLWELIDLAGGPSNDVNIAKIRVKRGGRVVVDNLLEGFEKAHSLDQLGVRSGDQIIVPAVSRLRFSDVMRYASFAMSAAVFYLQLTDRSRR